MVLWTGLGNWLPNDKKLHPGDYHDVGERVCMQGWRAGFLPHSSAVVRWPHELCLTWSDLNFFIYQMDGVGEGNFISACPKTRFTYSCNQVYPWLQTFSPLLMNKQKVKLVFQRNGFFWWVLTEQVQAPTKAGLWECTLFPELIILPSEKLYTVQKCSSHPDLETQFLSDQ